MTKNTKTTLFTNPPLITVLKDEGDSTNIIKKQPASNVEYISLFEEVGTHQVPLVGEEGICRLLLGLRQLHQVLYLKVSKFKIF
jgi:hypothetical protein